MQEKTNSVKDSSAQIGLHINRGKTKVLKINTTITEQFRLDDDLLEEVNSFTYLGSVVDIQGGTEADVKVRIGKARAVFLQLKNIWSSKDLKLQTKNRIFNSNVKPVLLYGSETWRTTVATTKKCRLLSTHVYEESCGYVGQSPSTTKTYGEEPTRGLQMLRS